MDLRVLQDYEALSEAAATVATERLRKKPDAVLLLPTGSTPLGMYRRLAELYAEGALSLSRTSFFNLDEYLGLSPNHPASYRTYMQEKLYRRLDADPERIHLPDGAASEPDVECRSYEEEIEKAGGVDLCVLGIGRNGHIGFNEPGAPFSSRTRTVRLAESTRRVNSRDFEDGAPERAITVGMETIFGSDEVLLLASGEDKAAAVAAAVEGPVTEGVPASMLQRHPNATFLVDRGAASALKEVA